MNHGSSRRTIAVVSAIGLSAAIFIGAVGSPRPARADNGAAFIGGMLAGHMLSRFARERREQTLALEHMAYSRPQAPAYSQQAPAPAPAQPTASSIEDQLNVLDQLAAKGYITKEQYNARKQAILNSL